MPIGVYQSLHMQLGINGMEQTGMIKLQFKWAYGSSSPSQVLFKALWVSR